VVVSVTIANLERSLRGGPSILAARDDRIVQRGNEVFDKIRVQAGDFSPP
jgi:hypothetical protein